MDRISRPTFIFHVTNDRSGAASRCRDRFTIAQFGARSHDPNGMGQDSMLLQEYKRMFPDLLPKLLTYDGRDRGPEKAQPPHVLVFYRIGIYGVRIKG